MSKYFFLLLICTLNFLSLYSQERDFLHLYDQIRNDLVFEDYDAASKRFELIRKDKEDYQTLDLLWFSLIQAKIIQKTKSEKEAGLLLFENLDEVELSKDSTLLSEYYLLIGDISNENGLPYLEQAINFCPKKNLKTKAKTFYHMARVYCSDSLENDACYAYYNKSLNLSKKTNSFYTVAKIYNNLSGEFITNGAPQKGLIYIDSSLLIRKEIGDENFLASGLLNKAILEIVLHKDETAYLESLLEIKNLLKNSSDYSLLYNLYYNLGDAYDRVGEYQNATNVLFQALETSEISKEKFKEKDLLLSIAEYEAATMKQDLEYAKGLSKLKTKEANLFKWITAIAFLTFGLIFYISLRNFRLKKKNLELDISQNKLESEKKLQQLNIEKKNEVLNVSIDAREEERSYISETLHNSISAILSSANMHLKVLKKKNNIPENEEFMKTQSLIIEAADQVRSLSHQLVSPSLQNFGLSVAVNGLCEKYSNSDLNFICEFVELKPRPDHKMEAKIYRIIEELINNIMKHSGANEAIVKGRINGSYLIISVADNGNGLDATMINKKESLGLTQIESIMDYLNGEFTLKSDQGTEVVLKFPINILYP